MSKPDKNHFFDWKKMESIFGKQFPFSTLSGNKSFDLSWVEDYVKSVMKQAMPQNDQPDELESEVFETHRDVIAKIAVPEHISPGDLRIFAASNQIRLEGLPGGAKQFIPLPAHVNPGVSRALMKQGVLQIQMRKQNKEEQYKEIFIRYH